MLSNNLAVKLIKLYKVWPTEDERREKLKTFALAIFDLVNGHRSALKTLTVILT
jgi:hypothetical protein